MKPSHSLDRYYAQHFPPIEGPFTVTGLIISDASGRTVATGWDAQKYVKTHGTAVCDRHNAAMNGVLNEMVRRFNTYNALKAVVEQLVERGIADAPTMKKAREALEQASK